MAISDEATFNSLSVEGFKSIRDYLEIELRPLTILAGANSSGKSSLMQPLLLLKQTFDASYDPGPLLISGPNVAFSSVDQMLWFAVGGKRADHFRIGLMTGRGKRAIGTTLTFESLGHKRGHKSIRIAECTWEKGNERCVLREGMPSRDIGATVSKLLPEGFVELFGELGEKRRTKWKIVRNRSLLAVSLDTPGLGIALPGPWNEVEEKIRSVLHVPGLRGNPRRTYKLTAVESEFPGLFQDYVASVIARWQETNEEKLGQIGEDLRELGLTWKVRARRVDDTQVEVKVGRLPTSKRGGARDLVSIADVGFGVSQVLAVVVSLLVATPGQLLYLEQPEIHLHPRAQVALASVLGRAVQRGVQVVAETHSELLLLGIQRLVADEQLSPGKVKMHWFSRDEQGVTQVDSADLDEQGAFGDWPVDFADVSLEAMRAYLDATTVRD